MLRVLPVLPAGEVTSLLSRSNAKMARGTRNGEMRLLLLLCRAFMRDSVGCFTSLPGAVGQGTSRQVPRSPARFENEHTDTLAVHCSV